jgi:hypothetical protein
MRDRTKLLSLRAIIIATLSLMPIGSFGDRVVLVTVCLFLTARGLVKKAIGLVRRYPLLTYAAYSTIAVVSAWGNSRYRHGGGPFHLSNTGIWRGYPVPFQEWDITPHGTFWREFYWGGLLTDIVLVVTGYVVLVRFLGIGQGRPFMILMLSIYCGTFVWLNIEVWLYGSAALFIESPYTIQDLTRQMETATLGFPFAYVTIQQRRQWAVVANVACGITGWLGLYGLSILGQSR